jgi:hypothetical protein
MSARQRSKSLRAGSQVDFLEDIVSSNVGSNQLTHHLMDEVLHEGEPFHGPFIAAFRAFLASL